MGVHHNEFDKIVVIIKVFKFLIQRIQLRKLVHEDFHNRSESFQKIQVSLREMEIFPPEDNFILLVLKRILTKRIQCFLNNYGGSSVPLRFVPLGTEISCRRRRHS